MGRRRKERSGKVWQGASDGPQVLDQWDEKKVLLGDGDREVAHDTRTKDE